MRAVVLHYLSRQGKIYRLATERDLEVFKEKERYLEEKRARLFKEWDIDPVSNEPTPKGEGRSAERAFSVRNYGLNTYGNLFNSRQKLALITFTEKVRLAYRKMIEESYEGEYAKAVVSYLGLGMDRLATYLSVLTRWRPDVLSFERVFDRQVMPMVGGVSPFNEIRGCWDLEAIWRVLSYLTQIPPVEAQE